MNQDGIRIEDPLDGIRRVLRNADYSDVVKAYINPEVYEVFREA